jgi:glyoxylase-like metal-dependent hydrolase (beta-lactamase superfamily II)/rhodanese-related sulfurtransferase
MIFEQLNAGDCKTYLVASEKTHEAMLVDPLFERADDYVKELERRGLKLKYVLDTHVHADHTSGAAALKQRTGATYLMHKNSVTGCVDQHISEGDQLMVGDVPVSFLHTPGHSQDSVTVLLPDRILTGDFLFLGDSGAGRTDLPGGDAHEHWHALRKLEGLSGTLQVFPAHDYHGRSSSTLDAERQKNPRFKFASEAEYVGWLNAQNLGPAEWMKDVISANYACAPAKAQAAIPSDKPSCEVGGTRGDKPMTSVTQITPDAVRALLASKTPVRVIDVREPAEWVGELGHVAGAKLFPLGQLSREPLKAAPSPEETVITICKAGGRSSSAAMILVAAGFKDVRSMTGGMTAWNAAGYPTDKSAA